MVAAFAWLVVVYLGFVEAQVFLPWENFQVPNDPNDEDDRKVTFDCYAECFDLKPSETLKKPLAKVQPHCYKKVSDMTVFKLGDTKIYISGERQISWLAAYARCRKNSLDLLGQGLATWDDEFANKMLKYFSDGDAFWLGGTNMVDNKLRWSDTGNDIAPTGRGAKITQSGTGPHCLEARVSGSSLTWGATPCVEAKPFVCVLQKPCMAAP